MKRFLKINLFLVTAAVAVFAQGPRGPQPGPGVPGGPASGLNMSAIQVIEGTVSAVDIDYRTPLPTITVNQTSVRVAPAWFLAEKEFELKTGEVVKVTAAPSVQATNILHAISITKANASLTLRDDQGFPLWAQGGRGAGPGRGMGCGRDGQCIDPASVTSVSGTVAEASYSAGMQVPTLVLQTDAGKLLTLRIGPMRALLEADLDLKTGDRLTVKYGRCPRSGQQIALEITNASGKKVVLRQL